MRPRVKVWRRRCALHRRLSAHPQGACTEFTTQAPRCIDKRIIMLRTSVMSRNTYDVVVDVDVGVCKYVSMYICAPMIGPGGL